MSTTATAFSTDNPKGPVHLDDGGGQWRNRFFDSEQRRDAAEARVKELQAIVDKLPKTADGVYVYPEMKVWVIDKLSFVGDPPGTIRSHEVIRICKTGWMFSDVPDGFIRWDETYSTPEAAAAALAAREGLSPEIAVQQGVNDAMNGNVTKKKKGDRLGNDN
jgi:hypothetical protein